MNRRDKVEQVISGLVGEQTADGFVGRVQARAGKLGDDLEIEFVVTFSCPADWGEDEALEAMEVIVTEIDQKVVKKLGGDVDIEKRGVYCKDPHLSARW